MPRHPPNRGLDSTRTSLAARLLGTSEAAINRIENGSLRISKKLALRVFWLTGVYYRDILKMQPLTRSGKNAEKCEWGRNALSGLVVRKSL